MDIHTFNAFGRYYIYDTRTSFLFGVDDEFYNILIAFLNGIEISDINHIKQLYKFRNILKRYSPINIYRKNTEVNLKSLTLILTDSCNMDCVYCYEGTKYQNIMSLGTAKKAIEFLIDNGKEQHETFYIAFFGGEPLLCQDLIQKIIEYIEDTCLKGKVVYSVTTNGTLLGKNTVDFLKKYNINITVSLDGTKEIHDKYRKMRDGGGTFDIIKANLLSMDKNDLFIQVNSLIAHNNCDYSELYNSMYDVGIKHLITTIVASNSTDIMLTDLEIEKLYNGLEKVYYEFLSNFVADKEFILFDKLLELKRLYPQTWSSTHCSAGINSVAINSNGDIYYCHRFVGMPSFGYGNVSDFTSKKLSSRFENNKHDSCSKCWIERFCQGGCPHENYVLTSSIDTPYQPYCKLYQRWYELAFASYAFIGENTPEKLDLVLEKSLLGQPLRYVNTNLD